MKEYYLRIFIMEAVKERLQYLVSIVNPLGVLPYNPDHGCPVE